MTTFQRKTVTLTWGCQAENHVGMQKVGNGLSKSGFTTKNLENVKKIFEEKGFECKLYDLNNEIERIEETGLFNIDKAEILVIKNGINLFTDSRELFDYLIKLDWDKKYWDNRRQRVLNKRARYNLVFGEFNQKADFENKKGTIYDINEIDALKTVKNELGNYFGDEFKNLECEGNYYYDINKCGIGYHGDSERKKVVGMRFGESCNLHYWWYYQSKRINNRISIPLDNGDIYIMNFKAAGTDWKKRNIYTLRHSTGCEKYIK
tara:strand:+ start:163 stop:951 length:789 start_codon:yes stop_codon:yes gene_type:complete